ncbi:hypothetical protein SVAN01_01557 [Stagonosporopsis vannaccii]|nr:hypothetical protein SVAN01_01557 [Stagonosporopsis vannaccii]
MGDTARVPVRQNTPHQIKKALTSFTSLPPSTLSILPPDPRPPAQLQGRLVQGPAPTKTANNPPCQPERPLLPPTLTTITAFHLHDPDHLVLEHGIVLPLHTVGERDLTHLLDKSDLHMGTIVSSRGVGGELEYGMAGEEVKELENEEERRHKAAVERVFDDRVTRDCIEEGYMPNEAEIATATSGKEVVWATNAYNLTYNAKHFNSNECLMLNVGRITCRRSTLADKEGDSARQHQKPHQRLQATTCELARRLV